MADQRYEYEYVDWTPEERGGFLESGNANPQKLLDEMAADGWRLAHTATTESGTYDQFIFERPIED